MIKIKPPSMTGLFVGGICVVVLGFGIYNGVAIHDYQETIADQKAEIQSLQSDYAKLSKEIAEQDESLTEESVDAVLSSAKTAGEDLASLENQYMDISRKMKATGISEDEYNSLMDQLNKIAEQKDEYLGENSDFRTAWFSWDPEKFDGDWKFCSNYDFSGKTSDVVWQLSSEDSLVAAMFATYDSETKQFTNLQRHVTVYGASLVGATGEEQSISQDTSTIFDIVNNPDVGVENRDEYLEDAAEQSEMKENGDFDGINEAREKLKQQQQKGAAHD